MAKTVISAPASGGKSIGKSTLCIKSNNFRKSGTSLPLRESALRSVIKGLSCSFALLGFANFACLLFSKQRRALHDLLSGSTCVLVTQNVKDEGSESWTESLLLVPERWFLQSSSPSYTLPLSNLPIWFAVPRGTEPPKGWPRKREYKGPIPFWKCSTPHPSYWSSVASHNSWRNYPLKSRIKPQV